MSVLTICLDMFIIWLPPEKLKWPFLASFAGFTMTVFGEWKGLCSGAFANHKMKGLLIWSVHHAGGTAGPYFAHDYKTDSVLANSEGTESSLS